MKSTLKDIFKIQKKNKKFQKLNFSFFYFLHILENNFYLVKRELPAEKVYALYSL